MNGFKRLSEFWLFRNKANFTLFFMGFSSTGYFVLRYVNEKKFEHPILQESNRLLHKNSQILELVGYPIVVETNLGSKAVIEDDEAYFSFRAKGPKGYVQVELEADSKTQGELVKNNELKTDEYYILDPEIYREITQISENDKELITSPISQDSKFWKIKKLQAELGGQYRIKILPQKMENGEEQNDSNLPLPFQKKKSQKQIEKEEEIRQNIKEAEKKQLQISQDIPYFIPTQRKSYNDLLIEEQRRKGNKVEEEQIQNLSDQELEEMRKFKMQQLYKKVGYIRFYMFLVFFGGGLATYNYIMKNKRVNIVGSTLHVYTNQLISRHPVVKQFLGQNIKFSQSLRGAQIGNIAEFENDFYGTKTKATANVKGVFNEKTNEWKIEKLDLTVFDFNGKLIKKQKLI